VLISNDSSLSLLFGVPRLDLCLGLSFIGVGVSFLGVAVCVALGLVERRRDEADPTEEEDRHPTLRIKA
jgi:hypothetical protein